MLKRMMIWSIVVAMLATALPAMAAKWQKIDAQSVKEKMDHGNPLVVFPLSRIEYNNLHIKDSVNIPLSKLAAELPADKNRELIFYCLGIKCTASPNAADEAVELGYKNVYAFIEGLPGWIKEGYAADIAVLDLGNIQTASDITQPHQYAEGVAYLLVNGAVVIDGGKFTGELAGEVIKLKK